MHKIICVSYFFFLSGKCLAQDHDTTLEKVHSPRFAMMASSIIPGSGQVYNRQYWKIPVIYAGMGGLIYSISYNNKYYREFKNAYLVRHDNDSSTTDPYTLIYTDDNLIVLKDYYKRYRDLSMIGTGLLYLLNVIDAYVFAQLYRFNVSQNLSMQVFPEIHYAIDQQNRQKSSFALTFVIR